MIADCNMAFCKEFGYRKTDLKDKHISSLCHPLLVEYQIEMFEIYSNNDDVVPILYVLHRNGYIVPVVIKIAETPNILNDFNFLELIYTDKANANSDIVYLLLDNDMLIQGITTTAILSLKLTIAFIKQSKVYLNNLCEELKGNNYEKYICEEEIPITYNIPDLNDEGEGKIFQDANEPLIAKELDKKKIYGLCKLTEISTKRRGKIGFNAKLKIISEHKHKSIIRKQSINNLEFQYNEKWNRYVQVSPNIIFK